MNETIDLDKQNIRLVCIDDDRSRDAIYKLFFETYSASDSSHFRVTLEIPASPHAAIRTIRSRHIHAAIVDVLLKKKWKSELVEDLIDVLGSTRVPIGFVSGDMGQEAAIGELRRHMSRLSENPKLGYFTYVDSFQRHLYDSMEDLSQGVRNASRLREGLISLWNVILMGVAANSSPIWRENKALPLTFMHLTDTHFGKIDVKQLSVEGIVDLVRQNDISIDALLWSGDIADKGLPSDYAEAKKFYDSLVSKGVLNTACPVLLVAGNHDHCWPLALAVNIELQDGAWSIGKAPNDAYRQLAAFRVQPFSDFYETITGRRLNAYRKGFAWIDSYISEGVIVLEFSIEEFGVIGIDAAARRDIDTIGGAIFDELRAIQDNDSNEFKIILLLIHGRDPNPIVQSQFNVFISRLAAKGFPIIVVGGHYHVGSTECDRSILYIVGTPVSDKVVEGTAMLPGVPFISLRAAKTLEIECIVTTYKFERNIIGVDENSYISVKKFRLRNDETKYFKHWIIFE